MKIELFALNVTKPVEMGDWYVKYLRTYGCPPSLSSTLYHFFPDDSGQEALSI